MRIKTLLLAGAFTAFAGFGGAWFVHNQLTDETTIASVQRQFAGSAPAGVDDNAYRRAWSNSAARQAGNQRGVGAGLAVQAEESSDVDGGEGEGESFTRGRDGRGGGRSFANLDVEKVVTEGQLYPIDDPSWAPWDYSTWGTTDTVTYEIRVFDTDPQVGEVYTVRDLYPATSLDIEPDGTPGDIQLLPENFTLDSWAITGGTITNTSDETSPQGSPVRVFEVENGAGSGNNGSIFTITIEATVDVSGLTQWPYGPVCNETQIERPETNEFAYADVCKPIQVKVDKRVVSAGPLSVGDTATYEIDLFNPNTWDMERGENASSVELDPSYFIMYDFMDRGLSLPTGAEIVGFAGASVTVIDDTHPLWSAGDVANLGTDYEYDPAIHNLFGFLVENVPNEMVLTLRYTSDVEAVPFGENCVYQNRARARVVGPGSRYFNLKTGNLAQVAGNCFTAEPTLSKTIVEASHDPLQYGSEVTYEITMSGGASGATYNVQELLPPELVLVETIPVLPVMTTGFPPQVLVDFAVPPQFVPGEMIELAFSPSENDEEITIQIITEVVGLPTGEDNCQLTNTLQFDDGSEPVEASMEIECFTDPTVTKADYAGVDDGNGGFVTNPDGSPVLGAPNPAVMVGDWIVYTITVNDLMPDETYVFTDTLPAEIDPATVYIDSTIGTPSENGAGVVTWTLSPTTYVQGAVLYIAVQVQTLPEGDEMCQGLVNEVTAEDANGALILTDVSVTEVCTLVSGTPAIAIEKTVDGEQNVTLGGELTYSLTITNTGDTPLESVNVLDNLPAGVSYVMATPEPTTQAGQLLVWNIDALAVGESVTITVVVETTASGEICNEAGVTAVSAGGANAGTGVESAPSEVCVTVEEPLVPGLNLSKEFDRDTEGVDVGGSFMLVVTNTGETPLTNVQVSDTLPAGMVFETSTPAPEGTSGQTVLWTIESLAVGESVTITVTYSWNQDAFTVDESCAVVVENTATVTSEETDGNETASDTVTVTFNCGVPDMSITKEQSVPDGTTVEVGSEITYTVTLTNTGEVALEDITVTENMPGQIDVTSVSPTPTAQAGDLYVWEFGTLGVGESIVMTMESVVTDPGEVCNRVSANALSAEGISVGTSVGTPNVIVCVDAELPLEDPVITKTLVSPAAESIVMPGDTLEYRIEIQNVVAGMSFQLADTFFEGNPVSMTVPFLQESVEFTPNLVGQQLVSGQVYTITLGPDFIGDTMFFHVVVETDPEFTPPVHTVCENTELGSYYNEVTISLGKDFTASAESECVYTEVILEEPYLKLGKATYETLVEGGQTFTWYIEVANVGQGVAPAGSITLTDTLDDAMIFEGATVLGPLNALDPDFPPTPEGLTGPAIPASAWDAGTRTLTYVVEDELGPMDVMWVAMEVTVVPDITPEDTLVGGCENTDYSYRLENEAELVYAGEPMIVEPYLNDAGCVSLEFEEPYVFGVEKTILSINGQSPLTAPAGSTPVVVNTDTLNTYNIDTLSEDDLVVYEIVVEGDPAQTHTLTDVMDASLTPTQFGGGAGWATVSDANGFGLLSPSQYTVNVTGQTYTFTFNGNASITYPVYVRVLGTAENVVEGSDPWNCNVVSWESEEEVMTSAACAPHEGAEVDAPEVQIRKTTTAETVSTGDEIRYTITVSRVGGGDVTEDVVVTDVFDEDVLEFVAIEEQTLLSPAAGPVGESVSGGEVEWTVPMSRLNDLNLGGTYTAQYELTFRVLDLDATGDNCATARNEVRADLPLTKDSVLVVETDVDCDPEDIDVPTIIKEAVTPEAGPGDSVIFSIELGDVTPGARYIVQDTPDDMYSFNPAFAPVGNVLSLPQDGQGVTWTYSGEEDGTYTWYVEIGATVPTDPVGLIIIMEVDEDLEWVENGQMCNTAVVDVCEDGNCEDEINEGGNGTIESSPKGNKVAEVNWLRFLFTQLPGNVVLTPNEPNEDTDCTQFIPDLSITKQDNTNGDVLALGDTFSYTMNISGLMPGGEYRLFDYWPGGLSGLGSANVTFSPNYVTSSPAPGQSPAVWTINVPQGALSSEMTVTITGVVAQSAPESDTSCNNGSGYNNYVIIRRYQEQGAITQSANDEECTPVNTTVTPNSPVRIAKASGAPYDATDDHVYELGDTLDFYVQFGASSASHPDALSGDQTYVLEDTMPAGLAFGGTNSVVVEGFFGEALPGWEDWTTVNWNSTTRQLTMTFTNPPVPGIRVHYVTSVVAEPGAPGQVGTCVYTFGGDGSTHPGYENVARVWVDGFEAETEGSVAHCSGFMEAPVPVVGLEFRNMIFNGWAGGSTTLDEDDEDVTLDVQENVTMNGQVYDRVSFVRIKDDFAVQFGNLGVESVEMNLVVREDMSDGSVGPVNDDFMATVSQGMGVIDQINSNWTIISGGTEARDPINEGEFPNGDGTVHIWVDSADFADGSGQPTIGRFFADLFEQDFIGNGNEDEDWDNLVSAPPKCADAMSRRVDPFEVTRKERVCFDLVE